MVDVEMRVRVREGCSWAVEQLDIAVAGGPPVDLG